MSRLCYVILLTLPILHTMTASTYMCLFSSPSLARSRLLVPAVDLIIWYFAVDLLAQWNTFTLATGAATTGQPEAKKLSGKLAPFIRKRWPFVVHHLVLLLIAWPLLVSGDRCLSWDGGPGDLLSLL